MNLERIGKNFLGEGGGGMAGVLDKRLYGVKVKEG